MHTCVHVTQMEEFLRFSQDALATIASYVDLARKDEEQRVTRSSSTSLVSDIRTIEEEGIYYILCSLEVKVSSDVSRQR